MNDSTCPRPCLMKLDLQSSTNKLAFLKDNWPSFGQIESIDRLSETELRCTLCLLDVKIYLAGVVRRDAAVFGIV